MLTDLTIAKDRNKAIFCSRLVAYCFNLNEQEIDAHTRGRARVSFARQIAMYLCNVSFKIPMNRVAIAMRRDRSTVAHACRIVEDCRDDPDWDSLLEKMEQLILDLPGPFELQPFYDRDSCVGDNVIPFELWPMDGDDHRSADLLAEESEPQSMAKMLRCANAK